MSTRSYQQISTTIYMFLAVLLEVAGTTSMKLADGFNNLTPSAFMFVFYLCSFVFLSLALKRLQVSLVYALWSGLGTTLIALIGIFCFNEPANFLKIVSLSLIIVGILGLRLG